MQLPKQLPEQHRPTSTTADLTSMDTGKEEPKREGSLMLWDLGKVLPHWL